MKWRVGEAGLRELASCLKVFLARNSESLTRLELEMSLDFATRLGGQSPHPTLSDPQHRNRNR